MGYSHKAVISGKARNANMVLVCAIGCISLLGLVMCIYSLFTAKFVFTVLYFIAVILGFSYLVMKINAFVPIYIANDDSHIYVQEWENGLFPFVVSKKFFDDFIPAKIVLKKIEVKGIEKIYIGSRNYLLKVVSSGDFYWQLKNPLKKHENMLKKLDFLYIYTKDNQEVYLPVNGFDYKDIAEIIKPVIEKNEKIDFKTNNRVIIRMIPQNKVEL